MIEIAAVYRDRFRSRVARGPIDTCWEWQATRNHNGYGKMSVGGRRTKKDWLAHRLALILEGIEIPAGMVVCHKCDNPPCCNPNHLYVGTMADNGHDRDSRGRTVIPLGEDNGRAKLTAPDVLAIRDMYARGMLQREIAALYDVSKAHIGYIVNRKSWKHI